MTRYEEIEMLEDEISNAINWHFGIDWDDIDADALYRTAHAVRDAWDDYGWYEVMSGGHVWGYAEPSLYGDRADLGAVVYQATIAASEPLTFDYLNDVWAYKVTDPDDVAELEAMLD